MNSITSGFYCTSGGCQWLAIIHRQKKLVFLQCINIIYQRQNTCRSSNENIFIYPSRVYSFGVINIIGQKWTICLIKCIFQRINVFFFLIIFFFAFFLQFSENLKNIFILWQLIIISEYILSLKDKTNGDFNWDISNKLAIANDLFHNRSHSYFLIIFGKSMPPHTSEIFTSTYAIATKFMNFNFIIHHTKIKYTYKIVTLVSCTR